MRGSGGMDWSSSMLDAALDAAVDARHVAAIVGQLGAAIVVMDRDLHVLAWNEAATKLYRWPPDALGRRLNYRDDDCLVLDTALDGHTTHLSTIGADRDGNQVIVSSVAAPVRDAEGTVVAAISVAFDRTPEVTAIRRARLQQRRQAVLLRLGRLAMQDGTDADVVRTACRLATRLLPSAAVAIGVLGDDGSLRSVAGADAPADLDAATAAGISAWLHDSPGNDHVVHSPVRPGRTSVFLWRADDGESLGLVAKTAQDTGWSAGDLQFLSSITTFLGSHLARRRFAGALRSRAMYDDLTGLANRSHLIEVLGKALAGADTDPPQVGLLFFDIDHFKEINDRFGHKGGDVVLLEIAARLRRCADEGDVVARLGGDEFVVLCRGVADEERLLRVGERFMEALAPPFLVANRQLRVTASCGAALADGSPDEEEALRWADVAMYDVKRNGRAHVRRFSAELGDARARELRTDAVLRERAAAGEFELRFQPRFALPGRRLAAIEARIEAAGADGGDSRRFIQLADELGTSTSIVASAIAEAIRAVHAVAPASAAVRVIVQVPADMLGEPALALAAIETLGDVGMGPERLTLQAVGAGVYGTNATAIHPSLTAAGIGFAVTDLGAQSTSLGGFIDPWAQEVLLAEELVTNLGGRMVARHFAEAATQFAIGIGLAVVADGVADEAQLSFLEAAGVSAAQGPLWGVRLSGADLATWLADHQGISPRVGRAGIEPAT